MQRETLQIWVFVLQSQTSKSQSEPAMEQDDRKWGLMGLKEGRKMINAAEAQARVGKLRIG